jgi:hypothetical protein
LWPKGDILFMRTILLSLALLALNAAPSKAQANLVYSGPLAIDFIGRYRAQESLKAGNERQPTIRYQVKIVIVGGNVAFLRINSAPDAYIFSGLARQADLSTSQRTITTLSGALTSTAFGNDSKAIALLRFDGRLSNPYGPLNGSIAARFENPPPDNTDVPPLPTATPDYLLPYVGHASINFRVRGTLDKELTKAIANATTLDEAFVPVLTAAKAPLQVNKSVWTATP